jgi:hypothetical protein
MDFTLSDTHRLPSESPMPYLFLKAMRMALTVA